MQKKQFKKQVLNTRFIKNKNKGDKSWLSI